MATPPLVPDPSCLRLMGLEADVQTITTSVASTATEATCPLCQQQVTQVHFRYLRRVDDLSWVGWSVRLRLHIRRFFCDNRACSRAILTERLPTVVAPMAARPSAISDFVESAFFSR